MGNNKVDSRPKGGAPRLDVVGTATISESLRRNNIVSALLCFTCGACFVLSLICTCLGTLVVLLDQTVEAASLQHGERTENSAAVISGKVEQFLRLETASVSIMCRAYWLRIKTVGSRKKKKIISPQEEWQNYSRNTGRDTFIARLMKVYSMCLCFVNAVSNVTGFSCVSHESRDYLAVDLKVLL